jgi:hypothetical protein
MWSFYTATMTQPTSDDPFSLEGRTGARMPNVARIWTKDEQAAKLEGYLEVTPPHWHRVRYSTHVRYFLKTGVFKAGGFVLNNPVELHPHGQTDSMRCMRLQSSFASSDAGYMQWTVSYDDMATLYIKMTADVSMVLEIMETVVSGLNENIRKLVEHAKKLEARIKSLE